jgi:hypothetical protein
MEANCSSKISVDFQRNTQSYILEERNLRKLQILQGQSFGTHTALEQQRILKFCTIIDPYNILACYFAGSSFRHNRNVHAAPGAP